MTERHRAERRIAAAPAAVYAALTTPALLVRWLPPEGATARILDFDLRPGGRIRIELTFAQAQGKTTANTDLVEGHFVELTPLQRVVQAFTFRADDPAFAGVMRMTWTLQPEGGGTGVEVVAQDVPPGIDQATHEQALAASLAQLAALLARGLS